MHCELSHGIGDLLEEHRNETVVAHALALFSVAFALVTTTTLRSAWALLELTGALGTIGMSIIAFTGAVLAGTDTVAVLWALLG